MKFQVLRNVVEEVDGVENLMAYGKTPLGVIAYNEGVFSTKDSYSRRERLVRNWAEQNYGDYADGLYRAVNRRKPLSNSTREFNRGYNHGLKLRQS